MSRLSEEGDQQKAEPQPGPSQCPPSRQGYCGYCRVLYSNLDQHLSSLRHLESVRASARGSGAATTHSSQSKLTLLERFLQDVLTHHPHRYNDPRPSHADLPAVSAPLLPRAKLDDICLSEDDGRLVVVREHLSDSDHASQQPANQRQGSSTHSNSGKGDGQERLSVPTREQKPEGTSPPAGTIFPTQSGPTPIQTTPAVHRKAHRKTNRRKTSEASSPPHGHRAPRPVPLPPPKTGPAISSKPRPTLCLGLGTGPGPPTERGPWLSWERERRAGLKGEAFSSDSSDDVDQTIEEVIQMCCYGVSSTPCQQEETESFHFSLPLSIETRSDDWDSPVQRPTPGDTPVQGWTKGRDLSRLMDVHVELEDQVYSYQLDSALNGERRVKGVARLEEGFWTLPIDEILPAPQHIPESFRGKTWAQVEQEDEDKVERLVRQFRREKFICYFDSESLARYGRRSLKRKACEDKEVVLPLLDNEEDDQSSHRRRKRRRRSFRLASRCQVVKVSHATQTVRLVVPAVRQPAEAPPTSQPNCPANWEAAERTPEQTWRCLPSSYSNIVTPLNPRTSVVYLLCSPSGPAHTDTPAADSTPKRSRKRRRPVDLQRLKVRYKQLPVRFYEPSSNRILKTAPKGSAPSVPSPCVRQLFRSLSPDLNTDGLETAPPHKHVAIRRRGDTAQEPAPPSYSRRGRADRPRPQNAKRTARPRATPPQPRREGLRPTNRQGRSRRGRGYERSRR
ncbi:DBF4-type zinc finger-containing protein 2 [Cheilinus undulatus]|uniref:DBF4-type zinc finger-containing protein 2 n=1 Tax=Cheilinus undulatus TaxID=241271 RepID=UPI001BD32ACC|nr:DBF4-type zinc finger-containing protein 2 [Cheilinus undulatus]